MANLIKIENIKKSKPFGWSDVIIFSIVIIIVILSVIFVYTPQGEKVEINYNGKKTYFSLLTDREIVIEDKITIIIKNKTVHVINSSCPDKLCEHMGEIKYKNQIIACAPQNIIVKIVGSETGKIVSGA